MRMFRGFPLLSAVFRTAVLVALSIPFQHLPFGNTVIIGSLYKAIELKFYYTWRSLILAVFLLYFIQVSILAPSVVSATKGLI